MLVGRLNPLFVALVALILGVPFGTATAGTAVAQVQAVSTATGGVVGFTYDAPGDVALALAGEPSALERSVVQWASTATPVGEASGQIYDTSVSFVAPRTALDDTAQLALPSGRFTNGNFAPGKLESHYLKHADEYGAIGIDAYLARARSLLSTDVGNGIRGFTRANGDTVRFNVRTGEFAAGAADGTIRTLFRPDDGLAYYLRQVPR